MLARYWRLSQIETYGYLTDLELSALALCAGGVQVDGSAAFTASIAPSAGSIGNLADDNGATLCMFAGADVAKPGFALVWDFGSDTAVDGLLVGYGSNIAMSMIRVAVSTSSDLATWTHIVTFNPLQAFTPNTSVLVAMVAQGAETALLLHADGADNSTTFVDSSNNAYALTVAAGTPKISTTQSLFGGSSLYFDGYSNIGIPASSGLGVFDGPFTLEVFVYPLSTSGYQELYDARTNGGSASPWVLSLANSGGSLKMVLFTGADTWDNNIVPINDWSHIALTWDGITMRFFVRGVLGVSFGFTTGLLGTTTNDIFLGGKDGGPTYKYNGYLDEFHITRGAALYVADFTPPGAPFEIAEASVARPIRAAGGAGTAIIASGGVVDTHVSLNLQEPIAHDLQWGGSGKIIGTVKEKAAPSNTPLARKVRLLHEKSGILVRETWSDPSTGAYTFTGIDRSQKYTALSYDHTHTYAPVAADNLTPETM